MLDVGKYIAVVSSNSDEVEITSYENLYKKISLTENQRQWLLKEWLIARLENTVTKKFCNLMVTRDEKEKMLLSWSNLD